MALRRRTIAEGVGTLLLILAATGSGLTAQHLFPDRPALGLLVSAGVTAGALVGLIVAFGSASRSHFNPLITGLQWLAGQRKLDCTLAYAAAQLSGSIVGATIASHVFGTGGSLVTPTAASWTLILSEVIASAGLMIVVFGCARSGRTENGPFAIGAWLAGAIFTMPSTSYANPAIALGAVFAKAPIALPATTALLYMPAEIAGALLALLVVAITYPLNPEDDRATMPPEMARSELLP